MTQRPKVGEILVNAGIIDESELRAALGDQSKWGGRLGVTLVKMGLVEERDLVRALAQQFQIPVVMLDGKRVQQEVLDLVPGSVAEKHLCVPLFVKEQNSVKTLYVGMDDPYNFEAIDELSFRAGMRVQPVLVSPSELCEAIDRFYHRGGADRALVLAGGTDGVASGGDAERHLNAAVRDSLYREVSGLESTDTEPSGGVEAAERRRDAAPAKAEPAASPDNRSDDPTRTILRALCQELIEKGVIDAADLQERVRHLEQKRPAS